MPHCRQSWWRNWSVRANAGSDPVLGPPEDDVGKVLRCVRHPFRLQPSVRSRAGSGDQGDYRGERAIDEALDPGHDATQAGEQHEESAKQGDGETDAE